MKIKQKIQALLSQLNKDIYEKQEIMALALLASLAGESIFLLGSVGIAKSLVARRLKYVFKDGSSFEYLMSRFSTPDEIFGNISVLKLKNEDKYERIVKNYLPSATVVFLDEIWKASPSIQNALLTVVNEKLFRNGEAEIKLPMKALISASNELPAKGEGLEALWDRFLLRYIVVGIQDAKNFNNMISKDANLYEDAVDDKNKITNAEYAKIAEGINNVQIPENILNIIHAVREEIEAYNNINPQNQIGVSDRRWKKIARLLKASAFLNDRAQIDPIDCFLIVHCIWDNPDHINDCFRLVSNAILLNGYKISFKRMDSIRTAVGWLKGQVSPEEQQPIAPPQQQVQQSVAVSDNSGAAIFEGDKPMSIKGYYMVLGLELYIDIDVYMGLGSGFQNVQLYEFMRGEYLTAGQYNLRKIGPCRIESDRPLLKTAPNNTLLMKTLGELPAMPNNTQQPSAQQQPVSLAPVSRGQVNKKQCTDTINNIRLHIDKQKKEIADYRQEQLRVGGDNLFVSASLNRVVIDCLNNAQIELEKMEVDTSMAERQLNNIK